MSKETIKNKFKNGMVPDEIDFGELIDFAEGNSNIFRYSEGTVGSEDAVNTIIGYKDNDVVSGIRGAHVQQGSNFNENIVGGDPSTIGKYEQNVVDTNITNAHYALIGGYDNVNNALAGLIISMHSYVSDLATHGAIYGGSFNEITDGDYSAIIGGTLSKIHGTDGGSYSFVAAGSRNSIYGKMSNISSGMHNRIGQESNQVEYSGIYNSYLSTTAGNHSIVLAGHECKANWDYSMARGKGAVSNNIGESVFSTGKFKTAGDSGQSTLHLMRQTDSAFETQLLLDERSSSILTPIGVNTTLTISGVISGHRVDAPGHASFKFNALLSRNSGSLEVMAFNKEEIFKSDPSYDINVKSVPTTNAYQILVKGLSGHIINWSCKLDTVSSRNI